MGDDIFKISKVEGKIKVSEDKRKTVSPYNSLKHFKNASLPANCNDCIYKSIDDGGNGKCPKYEKDSVCMIREEFQDYIQQLDTRNPEDLKKLLGEFIGIMAENTVISLAQMKMDGNIPDRNTITQLNSLLKTMQQMQELQGTVEVKETTELDKDGLIKSVFKELSAKKYLNKDAETK
ncbi:MAG: hypothetical protein H8D23_03590 [Candidatus Brocadiales bacterium]|nr:hypothetical protein [Candidatus Brocadiales bacterium]